MGKFWGRICAFAIALQCVLTAVASDDRLESVKFARSTIDGISALPSVDGVFSGIIDGDVVLAGGIDSLGSISDAVIVCGRQEDCGKAMLPNAIYDGASIVTPFGLVCAGGRNDTRCLSDVSLIKMTDGNPEVVRLPSLPEPLSGATAVADGYKVWLIGGCKDISGRKYSSSLYVLDLKMMQDGWKEVSSSDSVARYKAVGAIQSNGISPCLYVFGGRGVSGMSDDVVCYNIGLGRWSHVNCEVSEGFVAAVPVAANHIFIARQLQGSADSCRISLLRYHTVTNTMTETSVPNAEGVVLGIAEHDDGFVVLAADPVGTDLKNKL